MNRGRTRAARPAAALGCQAKFTPHTMVSSLVYQLPLCLVGPLNPWVEFPKLVQASKICGCLAGGANQRVYQRRVYKGRLCSHTSRNLSRCYRTYFWPLQGCSLVCSSPQAKPGLMIDLLRQSLSLILIHIQNVVPCRLLTVDNALLAPEGSKHRAHGPVSAAMGVAACSRTNARMAAGKEGVTRPDEYDAVVVEL